MPRRLAAVLAAVLVVAGALPAAAVAVPPRVLVDGTALPAGSPPVVDRGQLTVPVRPMAEALGYRVRWRSADRAVELVGEDRTLTLRPGQAWIALEAEGTRVVDTLGTPARMRGGILYVPLRPFLRFAAPGAALHWDPLGRRAVIRRPARDGGTRGDPGVPDGGSRRPGGTGQAAALQVLSYYTEEEPPTAPFGAYATLTRHAARMSAVAGFFTRLEVDARGNATGRLEPLAPAPHAVRRRVIDTAHRAGTPVYLLIHNLLYGKPGVGRRAAGQVLRDGRLRARLIAHVREVLDAEGYDGVNLDLEGIAPADRDAYTRFVRELAAALRPAGYAVTLSVPAKTSDSPSNAWGYPFDYRSLGQVADAVAVMTYDYHSYVTGPGPIAPLDWVRDVGRYAARTMEREKVLLGLAAHAFDWPLDGGRPRYLAAREALDRARKLGIRPRVDPALGAGYRYRDTEGRTREVWFETAETAAAKILAAQSLGLGGIALWRAGMEDPRLWQWLADKGPAVVRLSLRR